MISYTPVNVSPGPLAAGDGYVIAGKVTRYGAPDGLATAQCTYTDTAGPVLRVCTVDYTLDNGLIVTSGYIDGPGKAAPVALVLDGGTGAFAGARLRHAAANCGRQRRDPAPELTRGHLAAAGSHRGPVVHRRITVRSYGVEPRAGGPVLPPRVRAGSGP